MKKRLLSVILAFALSLGYAAPALSDTDNAGAAAERLHDLWLFRGIGRDSEGNINYGLEHSLTITEAITMLVRMLGKEVEAQVVNWSTPFVDLEEWEKPYVGYAYENGLISEISSTSICENGAVSATQYLTFVLLALGYYPEVDFELDNAKELSNILGITNDNYNNTTFTRGDAAIITSISLDKQLKDGSRTLRSVVEEALVNASDKTKKFGSKELVVDYGDSLKFAKEEISLAIDAVKMKFNDSFNGCYLKRVWYSEDYSDSIIDTYMTYGHGLKNGVERKNVIVLLSDYFVANAGDDVSLDPYTTYTNWHWILIRENETTLWQVDDMGY